MNETLAAVCGKDNIYVCAFLTEKAGKRPANFNFAAACGNNVSQNCMLRL